MKQNACAPNSLNNKINQTEQTMAPFTFSLLWLLIVVQISAHIFSVWPYILRQLSSGIEQLLKFRTFLTVLLHIFARLLEWLLVIVFMDIW